MKDIITYIKSDYHRYYGGGVQHTPVKNHPHGTNR